MSENLYGNLDGIGEEVIVMAKNNIHDNVTLDDIVYENAEYETLTLKFSRKHDSNVSVFNSKIFQLTKADWMDDEGFVKSRINWNSIMKHIATKFGIEDADYALAVQGSTSFQDFCNKYIGLVKPKLDGRKLYLKIYHKGNYGNFPKYPPFLQTMSSGVCSLQFTGYEKEQIAETEVATNADDFSEVTDTEGLDLT